MTQYIKVKDENGNESDLEIVDGNNENENEKEATGTDLMASIGPVFFIAALFGTIAYFLSDSGLLTGIAAVVGFVLAIFNERVRYIGYIGLGISIALSLIGGIVATIVQ